MNYWPQIVMGVLFVIGFVSAFYDWFQNDALTSTHVTTRTLILAVLYAGFAYVLHAGGFW